MSVLSARRPAPASAIARSSRSRINVLWVIDHVCYDGNLHGGGRLYWNVLPRFDPDEFRIVPCMLRASDTIRSVFATSPVPVSILDKRKFDPTTLSTFLRLIRGEQIHVMHLHCYGASTFGRLAGVLAGIPTIIHDYDTEVYFPYPTYLSVADRLLAPVTRLAIAASPMVRDFLVTKRKIDDARIRVMLHAIPPEKFVPASPEAVRRAREKLHVGEGAKVVGTVTKLGPQRGNQVLLEAAAQVVKSQPDTVFVLLYQPTHLHRRPNREYVEVTAAERENSAHGLAAVANELGIARQVRLVETSSKPDDVVTACDLIVAPFLSERFSSVSVLEAMAIGKPVIASDLGELPLIVNHNVNGYLVAPADVAGLASRMLEVLSGSAQLERFGQAARETAQRYSADEYARTLQDWYRHLAMISRGRRRN
jgi:glycosyltransferase involved in cell wall biosynthesis